MMIELTGTNLNKRHQEFNAKVNEAAKSNVDFVEVKDKIETTDLDRLFKIDLASKHKNIAYILEILKSGDSLYISRALSCDWIFDDEFAQFMNPQYLEQNIFPSMSSRMKKKAIATICLYVRNPDRAEEFHNYCMRNKMKNHGINFLLYTKESFKIEFLTRHQNDYSDFHKNEKYLENFIGNSFTLVERYLELINEFNRPQTLHKFRFLYSISANQYLDLLEKYHTRDTFSTYGKRFSESIIKKHKQRVLRDPYLYLRLIKSYIVLKYSNSEDAKIYATAFLPGHWDMFWQGRYYDSNFWFLDLIPLGERFNYIKKIFTEKYPGQSFEDNYYFYYHSYYAMMTQQEKEDWALRQIASDKEIHGSDNNYIWYRFINFSVAFVEIKKYIIRTTDGDKRSQIVETLVESAKTQEELSILLDYYCERHINELRDVKKSFMDKVIAYYDVLSFNGQCWASFEKILYSLDVYNNLYEYDYQNLGYRVLLLKYYIIYEKPIPKMFYDWVIRRNITIDMMRNGFYRDCDGQKLEKIFQYMLSCFTKHVESNLIDAKEEESRMKLHKYINYILDIIVAFGKTLENISGRIKGYVMLNMDYFMLHRFFINLREPSPVSQFQLSDIIHYLKSNKSLVISEFDKIREYFGVYRPKRLKRNINWLIRKIRIYFSHDISPEYIKLLNECLDIEDLNLQTARVAVFGILNLSDDEYRINFLQKYVPVNPIIDHVNINRNLLTVQTAICSVACHSRPPLPLSHFRSYIKGDYLQYCLSIFDAYLANMTPEQNLCFVESLLDSPVSVQKHGLRLAFHCFSTENLKNLVLKVWKKMKNVSIRKILYKAMFDKVNDCVDDVTAQLVLFEALTSMTSTLHQDDDEELFQLLVSLLPDRIFGKHLETGYNVVKDFPKRLINFQRFSRIINTIATYVHLVSHSFVQGLMEEHITTMMDQNLMLDRELKDGHREVIDAKWSLIKISLIKHKDVYILNILLDKFLSNWYKTQHDLYIYIKFFMEFLSDLDRLSYNEDVINYLQLNNMFRLILNKIENDVPSMEIYITRWKYKISIIARQVLGECMPKSDDDAKEVILKFSTGIKDLIKGYIEKNMFLKTFHNEIKNEINNGLMIIHNTFYHYYGEIDNSNLLLYSVLLEYDCRDLQLFVMDLIPLDYNGRYMDVYKAIIQKLMLLDDEEVKYFMCYKFFGSDYRRRDFMHMHEIPIAHAAHILGPVTGPARYEPPPGAGGSAKS